MHTLEISVDTIFSQQSVFLLRNFQYEFPDFFRINFFDWHTQVNFRNYNSWHDGSKLIDLE